MLDHIIAKSASDYGPGEALLEHTDTVVEYWRELHKSYVDELPVRDDFWKLSFLAALFHDSGKITGNFQERITKRVKHWDNHIRHEFFSGVLLWAANRDVFAKDILPLMAVFSHHKPLTDELFKKNNGLEKALQLNEIELTELLEELAYRIEQQKVDFLIFPNLAKGLARITTTKQLYKSFKSVYNQSVDLKQEDRRTYIFYKALLNTADWSGSNHGLLGGELSTSENELRGKIIQKLIAENKPEIAAKFHWRKFQLASKQQVGHVLAIAPTGSGKTEAALLWAAQKKEREKIIYLLPTRVTSNAIYNRLQQYFGKEETAVIHSSAFFYRKELDEEDRYHKGDYLMDKTFFRNVNVCTIDQVLTQGFNLGYWELKTFHTWKSWIIIDEIHLYAPYTLGLIISTIEYLKSAFHARFFIMTATMPTKLRMLLQQTLEIGETQIVRDVELLKKKRNEFQVRDCLIDGLETEIIVALKAGKKVLIVVNTVDEAIRLYQAYKGIAADTICYHSRFIQKHRLEKEQLILQKEKEAQSLLLVATQVVEVSLDIDFDILFTENAPIDAIIQRAGRVNRKRQKKDTKVIVCREQQVTREVIYTEVDGVLDNTFNELKALNGEKLSEEQLLGLVDVVYQHFEVQQHQGFLEGRSAYAKVQRHNHFIKDVMSQDGIYTREGLDTVSIIPACYYEELINANPMEKAQHELSIRRKKIFSLEHKGFQTLKNPDNQDPYIYLCCKYDSEVGLVYEQPSTIVHC
ncbi:CRISPR-associated helicase/endonuclease Cas3 [Lewinella cohaerens]|uniref:CRISPR-associated helicase/endonuclease Cas3 n=1 Tax=Lewinella cohaerens TaxID=70995 RepID=UPI0003698175|nr:CRISPR-associated helicase/endonuclease Cas3 [Lewinella cohaerens]